MASPQGDEVIAGALGTVSIEGYAVRDKEIGVPRWAKPHPAAHVFSGIIGHNGVFNLCHIGRQAYINTAPVGACFIILDAAAG